MRRWYSDRLKKEKRESGEVSPSTTGGGNDAATQKSDNLSAKHNPCTDETTCTTSVDIMASSSSSSTTTTTSSTSSTTATASTGSIHQTRPTPATVSNSLSPTEQSIQDLQRESIRLSIQLEKEVYIILLKATKSI